jgi:hypothetical protein
MSVDLWRWDTVRLAHDAMTPILAQAVLELPGVAVPTGVRNNVPLVVQQPVSRGPVPGRCGNYRKPRRASNADRSDLVRLTAFHPRAMRLLQAARTSREPVGARLGRRRAVNVAHN